MRMTLAGDLESERSCERGGIDVDGKEENRREREISLLSLSFQVSSND
jgi:hypothetical protein